MTLIALLIAYQAQVSKGNYELADSKACAIHHAVVKVGGEQAAYALIESKHFDDDIYTAIEEASCEGSSK